MLRGARKILWGCGVIAVVVTLILVFGGDNVFSHSGRTDSSGGHYNRKTGGYHYHGGGPARPTVPSKSSAIPKKETPNVEAGVENDIKLLRQDIKLLRKEIALLRKEIKTLLPLR